MFVSYSQCTFGPTSLGAFINRNVPGFFFCVSTTNTVIGLFLGLFGVGGADTEKEAGDIAVDECTKAGGSKCTLAVTYEQCGALAVSGKGEAGWGKAPTKKDAEAQALEGCKGDSCSVVVSDCNDE